jgi:hypothetical protein
MVRTWRYQKNRQVTSENLECRETWNSLYGIHGGFGERVSGEARNGRERERGRVNSRAFAGYISFCSLNHSCLEKNANHQISIRSRGKPLVHLTSTFFPHPMALSHLPKYDIEQSNIALLGSDVRISFNQSIQIT